MVATADVLTKGNTDMEWLKYIFESFCPNSDKKSRPIPSLIWWLPATKSLVCRRRFARSEVKRSVWTETVGDAQSGRDPASVAGDEAGALVIAARACHAWARCRFDGNYCFGDMPALSAEGGSRPASRPTFWCQKVGKEPAPMPPTLRLRLRATCATKLLRRCGKTHFELRSPFKQLPQIC